MPKTLSKALFNRLLRSRILRETLESLHELSGMDCLFLDELGNERVAFPRRSEQAFRRLVAREPRLAEAAARHRQARLMDLEDDADPGCLEVAHPLRIEQETVGFLLLSAARKKEQAASESHWIWSGYAKAGSSLSWDVWSTAWRELPALSPRQEAAWRSCLELYAGETLRRLEAGTGMLPEVKNLPPLVTAGCREVRENYMEPLRLQDVARRFGVSAEHLSRIFHASTGLRFREYLAETRVNAACAALVETEDRISEIAGRCGFSTLSRFNQCFREVAGMTPREWRKRARMRS